MSHPTGPQLDDWIAERTTVLAGLPARYLVHLERERVGGTNRRDGYPVSTGAGGGGGTSTDTTVERAAIANAEQGDQRDEHRQLTHRLRDVLHRIGDDIDLAASLARRLDGLATITNPIDDSDWCTHHLATLQVFRPVADGSTLCVLCDDLLRTQGTKPPRALLDWEHRNGKYPPANVIEQLYAEAAQRATKDRKRKRRVA